MEVNAVRVTMSKRPISLASQTLYPKKRGRKGLVSHHRPVLYSPDVFDDILFIRIFTTAIMIFSASAFTTKTHA